MRATEMIRARIKKEPAFRDALYEECQQELQDGNREVAEHILREYLELPEEEVREIMGKAPVKPANAVQAKTVSQPL